MPFTFSSFSIASGSFLSSDWSVRQGALVKDVRTCFKEIAGKLTVAKCIQSTALMRCIDMKRGSALFKSTQMYGILRQ
jgi:hypothetical protein